MAYAMKFRLGKLVNLGSKSQFVMNILSFDYFNGLKFWIAWIILISSQNILWYVSVCDVLYLSIAAWLQCYLLPNLHLTKQAVWLTVAVINEVFSDLTRLDWTLRIYCLTTISLMQVYRYLLFTNLEPWPCQQEVLCLIRGLGYTYTQASPAS